MQILKGDLKCTLTTSFAPWSCSLTQAVRRREAQTLAADGGVDASRRRNRAQRPGCGRCTGGAADVGVGGGGRQRRSCSRRPGRGSDGGVTNEVKRFIQQYY